KGGFPTSVLRPPSSVLRMRHVDAVFAGEIPGFLIAGVGVADDAHAGVAGEHALQAPGGLVGAVGHDDLAGVQAIAHADPAAVMEAHPTRPASDVEHGVSDRPVGARVAAVLHRLGLAVGAGDAAAIQAVAADALGSASW